MRRNTSFADDKEISQAAGVSRGSPNHGASSELRLLEVRLLRPLLVLVLRRRRWTCSTSCVVCVASVLVASLLDFSVWAE